MQVIYRRPISNTGKRRPSNIFVLNATDFRCILTFISNLMCNEIVSKLIVGSAFHFNKTTPIRIFYLCETTDRATKLLRCGNNFISHCQRNFLSWCFALMVVVFFSFAIQLSPCSWVVWETLFVLKITYSITRNKIIS